LYRKYEHLDELAAYVARAGPMDYNRVDEIYRFGEALSRNVAR